MTRDEAGKLARGKLPLQLPVRLGDWLIEMLEELKVVKFDQPPPKDAAFYFVGAWNSKAAQQGGPLINTVNVKSALEAAGLELVEKK